MSPCGQSPLGPYFRSDEKEHAAANDSEVGKSSTTRASYFRYNTMLELQRSAAPVRSGSCESSSSVDTAVIIAAGQILWLLQYRSLSPWERQRSNRSVDGPSLPDRVHHSSFGYVQRARPRPSSCRRSDVLGRAKAVLAVEGFLSDCLIAPHRLAPGPTRTQKWRSSQDHSRWWRHSAARLLHPPPVHILPT